MRTSLLPGLFRVAAVTPGAAFADLALFEIGNVARAKPGAGLSRVAPILPVDRRPTPAEIAELDDALPDQPRLISVLLTGRARGRRLVGSRSPCHLPRRDRGRAHDPADHTSAV